MPTKGLFEATDIPEKIPKNFKKAQAQEAEQMQYINKGGVAMKDEPINKVISEPVQEQEEIELQVEETKPKKKRKELTPERKAQLAQQLKKARETSAINRTAKAKKKKLAELKTLENEVATEQVNTVIKKVGGLPLGAPAPPKPKVEETMSEMEKKFKAKYDNEYSHKIKDYEINHLKSQLEKRASSAAAPAAPIAVPAKKVPVKDTISPFKNQRMLDKYKKLRQSRGF